MELCHGEGKEEGMVSARCARILTKKPEKALLRKYHGPEQSGEEVSING